MTYLLAPRNVRLRRILVHKTISSVVIEMSKLKSVTIPMESTAHNPNVSRRSHFLCGGCKLDNAQRTSEEESRWDPPRPW
jgi:hypothetical protein